MIDYKNINLFSDDSVDKQFLIATDDNSVTITNTELHQNSFELKEKLFSGNNIVFGSCESSVVNFTVSNVFTQLKNKWVNISITLDNDTDNRFNLGRYKIYSDVPTADRKKRNIVAYDALYDILQADVAGWYNNVLPNKNSKVTLKAFRNSFFNYFGIEQEEIDLVNDNMIVEKTVEPETLSGKNVINAICEINGCFGRIGRDGKFKYVYLPQSIEGLYPAQDLYPSENLYPRASDSTIIGTGSYIPPCTYEDYKVQSISGLQIRQEEDDIGAQVGSADNMYVIQDNFLVYGKGASDLKTIAENVLDKIKGIVYKPFNTKARGNPCIEVGDSVRLNTKTQRVETYVFERTLSGIQSLRDSYASTGTEKLDKKVNSIQRSITQLKGKTSELKRTSEEILLSVTDLERNTNAKLSILSNEISLKVTSGQVQSMIKVALDEVVIRSDQIRLEGYTTINGGFSVDESGNAILKYGDYTAQMQAAFFTVGNNSMGYSALGGNSLTFTNQNGALNGIRKINGYEPVTSSNIEYYLADLEARVSALEGGL